jgi:hypothetical protein
MARYFLTPGGADPHKNNRKFIETIFARAFEMRAAVISASRAFGNTSEGEFFLQINKCCSAADP